MYLSGGQHIHSTNRTAEFSNGLSTCDQLKTLVVIVKHGRGYCLGLLWVFGENQVLNKL